MKDIALPVELCLVQIFGVLLSTRKICLGRAFRYVNDPLGIMDLREGNTLSVRRGCSLDPAVHVGAFQLAKSRVSLARMRMDADVVDVHWSGLTVAVCRAERSAQRKVGVGQQRAVRLQHVLLLAML